jgi:esterase/lipase
MGELQAWHTVVLDNEFTADDATPQATLQDYLDREQRLFAEVDRKVYRSGDVDGELLYSRYWSGGVQDPAGQPQNWNRTFELVPDEIKGGALLLHGLTDSPYSLRRVGQILYEQGYYVLGLRLPAHGTIPGALTRVRWEDWVAASRLGARHVSQRIGPDKPFLLAGYSNGGGLSVKYALDAMSDGQLRRPDQLLLFSPEIGIEPLARIANAYKLLSFLPYFEKFKWLSIEPEYDPFKYNSFPKNAAEEAWEVTAAIHREIKVAHDSGLLRDFPPVLTFLSWTDATVETSATVTELYDALENKGSELVIFDVNRSEQFTAFIPAARETPLNQLEARTDLPYRLTVITNVNRDSQQVAEHSRAPLSGVTESRPLDFTWPQGTYSLAHVAIPFAADDPIYGLGDSPPGAYHGLPLGALQPRGETRVLTAPLSQLMRLRHNPFFGYIEQRIVKKAHAGFQTSDGGPP